MGHSKSNVKGITRGHNLNIASWNIGRGIITKQAQIEQLIKEENLDIICLQETDFKYYSDKNPVKLDGFVTFTNLVKTIEDKVRLMVFVREDVKASLRNDLMSEDFCSIWIEIMGHKKFILGTFYREWDDGSGDKSLTYQRTKLQNLFQQIYQATSVSSNKIVAVTGDMNIDLNRANDMSYPLRTMLQDLQSCLAEGGLINIDLGNTFTAHRLKMDGTKILSAIDHLYISNPSMLKSYKTINNGLSDHSPVKFIIELRSSTSKTPTVLKRSFKTFDQNMFNRDLAAQPWDTLAWTTDVNQMTKAFTDLFVQVLDKHAPYKLCKLQKGKSRFKLSYECLGLMKKRDATLKTIKKSAINDPNLLKMYRSFRNRVTSLIRKERKERIAEEIERDPSSQNIWRVINQQIAPRRNETIRIKEENEEIKCNRESAEIFNNFFQQKIQGLRDRINVNLQDNPLAKMAKKMEGKENISFRLKTVSEAVVLKILKNIKPKRSHGFDDISAELLKKSAEIVVVPLTWIINTSIANGIFPEVWKLAIVKPLHKKGSKSDKGNYRPISLLSAPSMILERVIRHQVVKYMEENELFSENQFGFRSNKSTVGALISLLTTCYENAEEDKISAITMYDLSAAFDCLDSNILCSKLKHYGFEGTAIKWIRSYLTGRKQRVVVGDSWSSDIEIPFGCPQGSCLSPCLFVILISDIELWVKNSMLVGYCDDTSGVIKGKSREEAKALLKEDSLNILKYMATNLLVINPSKTCILITGTKEKQETDIVMIGEDIVETNRHGQLLGLDLNDDLSWRHHINNLTRVLNQRIAVIKRLRETMHTPQLITVGESLFNSKIRYGIAVYGSVQVFIEDPKCSQMQILQTLQNTLMRIVLGVKRLDRVAIAELLEKTGYLSVNQLATYHTLIEMYNVIANKSIPNICDKITRCQNEFYNTRQNYSGNVTVPWVKKKKNQGFSTKGAKLWNLLPTQIKSLGRKKSFASSVKKWIIDNIPI